VWRLDHSGIDPPKKTGEPLLNYAHRTFARQGFVDALTPTEKMMRCRFIRSRAASLPDVPIAGFPEVKPRPLCC
jgi:hypothetical protein